MKISSVDLYNNLNIKTNEIILQKALDFLQNRRHQNNRLTAQ
jgi:hypothetical protein